MLLGVGQLLRDADHKSGVDLGRERHNAKREQGGGDGSQNCIGVCGSVRAWVEQLRQMSGGPRPIKKTNRNVKRVGGEELGSSGKAEGDGEGVEEIVRRLPQRLIRRGRVEQRHVEQRSRHILRRAVVVVVQTGMVR